MAAHSCLCRNVLNIVNRAGTQARALGYLELLSGRPVFIPNSVYQSAGIELNEHLLWAEVVKRPGCGQESLRHCGVSSEVGGEEELTLAEAEEAHVGWKHLYECRHQADHRVHPYGFNLNLCPEAQTQVKAASGVYHWGPHDQDRYPACRQEAAGTKLRKEDYRGALVQALSDKTERQPCPHTVPL